MADASGFRQTTCPWRALHEGFVAAVLEAHRWWVKGALSLDTIPEALRRGINVYDGALNSVQVHDLRKETKRNEPESEPVAGPIKTRLPRAPSDQPRRRRR